MQKATKRTLIILSIITALLGASGATYAIKYYSATFTYQIKPIASATWNSDPYDLGILLAGDSGTKTYVDALTVQLNKPDWININFAIDGNLTELKTVFDTLRVTIKDSGGVRASLDLDDPQAVYSVQGIQTITFTVVIDYTVDEEAQETSGQFHLNVWFTTQS